MLNTVLYKKVQSFLQTDLQYLLKNTSVILLGKVATTLIGICLAYVTANYLSLDTFGTYTYIITLSGVITTLSLTGLTTAITRAVAQGYDRAFIQGKKTYLKWSFGILFSALIVSGYYFIKGDITLSIAILLVGALLPFVKSFEFYDSFLVGKKYFTLRTILQVFQVTISASSMITVILVSGNLLAMIFTYFLTLLVWNLLCYCYLIKYFKPNKSAGAETFNFGKHLSLMGILSQIANSIDSILTFYFLGTSQLAIYTFATLIPKQIKGTFFSMNTLILPKLSTRNISEIKRTLPRKVLLFFFLLLSTTLTYVFLAPFLFNVFFPQYIEAIKYTQFAAFTIVFTATMPLRQVLLAHAKKRELYISQITIPLCKVVLMSLLIPFFGLWGAIVALLVTRTYNSLLYIFLFIKLKE